nr:MULTISPECIES: class I SAM-dependent methyltransferase [Streptomyces]
MNPHHDAEIARINRSVWDRWSDGYQSKHGEFLTGQNAEAWGLWRRPESGLRILDRVRGRDVLEAGCGAAAWSRSLARRGARVTAVDISSRQICHALRRCAAEESSHISFLVANAERLPFRDSTFDVVFSDYGALSWADPYLTVPEISRVLRPGGQLAFCTNSPFFALCWDPDARTLRPELRHEYFGLHTREVGQGAVDYVLPYGEWIRLFRAYGMTVEALIEEPPVPGSTTTFTDRPAEWTGRWPLESIWSVRKVSDTGAGSAAR